MPATISSTSAIGRGGRSLIDLIGAIQHPRSGVDFSSISIDRGATAPEGKLLRQPNDVFEFERSMNRSGAGRPVADQGKIARDSEFATKACKVRERLAGRVLSPTKSICSRSCA
jgi:hypothetical protein